MLTAPESTPSCYTAATRLTLGSQTSHDLTSAQDMHLCLSTDIVSMYAMRVAMLVNTTRVNYNVYSNVLPYYIHI